MSRRQTGVKVIVVGHLHGIQICMSDGMVVVASISTHWSQTRCFS